MGRNSQIFCPHCKKNIRSDKFKHHLQSLKRKQERKQVCKPTDRQCQFCHNIFSKTNFSKHLKICQENQNHSNLRQMKQLIEVKTFGTIASVKNPTIITCYCKKQLTREAFEICRRIHQQEDSSLLIKTLSEVSNDQKQIRKKFQESELKKIHYVNLDFIYLFTSDSKIPSKRVDQ